MSDNSPEELNKKAQKIKKVYDVYLANLYKLQQKQLDLINNFIKIVEAEKIKQARNSLKNK